MQTHWQRVFGPLFGLTQRVTANEKDPPQLGFNISWVQAPALANISTLLNMHH